MKDVIIIGAGIIGSTIAYQLSKKGLKVQVIEKNSTAGMDVSKHNSAIVHSGVDPQDGTLKAKHGVIGSKMYEEYAKELNTPYKKIGAFLVSHSKDNEPIIDALISKANNRDVFVERLKKEDALLLEPNLPSTVYEVLSMPTTAIIDPFHLSNQAINKARDNGVIICFNENVVDINIDNSNHFKVITNTNTYTSKTIVNAAGLYASEIERMVSPATFELSYIQGDYIILSQDAYQVSSRVLYPLPTNHGKGVLIVPQINKTILVGPTAIKIENHDNSLINQDSIDAILNEASIVASNIPYTYQIGTLSGIRPKELNNDFIIEENPYISNFFNVVGIDSPGIASAPSIAVDFVENILLPKLNINTD